MAFKIVVGVRPLEGQLRLRFMGEGCHGAGNAEKVLQACRFEWYPHDVFPGFFTTIAGHGVPGQDRGFDQCPWPEW
jgi:hypothetical protein